MDSVTARRRIRIYELVGGIRSGFAPSRGDVRGSRAGSFGGLGVPRAEPIRILSRPAPAPDRFSSKAVR